MLLAALAVLLLLAEGFCSVVVVLISVVNIIFDTLLASNRITEVFSNHATFYHFLKNLYLNIITRFVAKDIFYLIWYDSPYDFADFFFGSEVQFLSTYPLTPFCLALSFSF